MNVSHFIKFSRTNYINLIFFIVIIVKKLKFFNLNLFFSCYKKNKIVKFLY